MSSGLEVRDLSCRVSGRVVFAGVSFSVLPGRKLALLGANGSGKSTLLNALLGFLPYEGSIRVDGQELRDAPEVIRRKAGVMFACIEDQLLLPTVYDEIAFGIADSVRSSPTDDKRVTGILERFGLVDQKKRSPFELSNGEKQKTVLASILAARPDYILLDEPTKEIDCRSRAALIEMLKGLSCSMIISTHDYVFARETCGPALVLSRSAGRYFEISEFLRDAGVLKELELL